MTDNFKIHIEDVETAFKLSYSYGRYVLNYLRIKGRIESGKYKGRNIYFNTPGVRTHATTSKWLEWEGEEVRPKVKIGQEIVIRTVYQEKTSKYGNKYLVGKYVKFKD